MKSILITYNQALTEVVANILERQNIRGYTQWQDVSGRGSQSGEPHFGTHTWPAMNSAILTVVEDHRAKPLMDKLAELDAKTPEQGLRAFLWNIEGMI